MGALSSWASLAITHHLLVQFAYHRVYGFKGPLTLDNWYDQYEVLGDDIILFDPLIAKEYLQLMEALGVPINTMKSVVAKVPVTEFAKVTSYWGSDCSALSWAMFMSGNTLMGRANILFSLLRRRLVPKDSVNKYIARVAKISQYKAGNLTPTLIALWTMLANVGVIHHETAVRALISGKETVFRLGRAILYTADVNKITLAIPALFTTGKRYIYESSKVAAIFKVELPWMQIALWKPLAVFQAKRDIEKDATQLTSLIFSLLLTNMNLSGWVERIPELRNTILELPNTDIYGAPLEGYEGQSIEVLLQDLRVLYTALYREVYEQCLHMGGPDTISGYQMDTWLERLLQGNKDLDRYREFLDLVTRTQLKLDPEYLGQAHVTVTPTRLWLLRLLRKMSNRPAFTTAAAFW